MQIYTAEEVRSAFLASGLTIADWAKQNGFKTDLVYSVLRGRVRGARGEAHRIAVALGLKDPSVSDGLIKRLTQESTEEKEAPMAEE